MASVKLFVKNVDFGLETTSTRHLARHLKALYHARMANDESVTPEVIPPPTGAAERNRAYRISKAVKEGRSVAPEDLTWLTEYEKAKQSRHAAKSRKVTYSSEETESAATGDMAVAAALAAPQLAREEGRRIDSLIREATNATASANKMTLAACEVMMKFAVAILERNGKLEQNTSACSTRSERATSR